MLRLQLFVCREASMNLLVGGVFERVGSMAGASAWAECKFRGTSGAFVCIRRHAISVLALLAGCSSIDRRIATAIGRSCLVPAGDLATLIGDAVNGLCSTSELSLGSGSGIGSTGCASDSEDDGGV